MDDAEPAVEELEHENEELERENEELRSALEAKSRPKQRGRTIGAWVLLVLACLLAMLSVVVVYARNELLNTDTFVATLAPLAKDPAVQTAVATRVSDNLVARTDLEQRVKNALPARAGFLADADHVGGPVRHLHHHPEAGAELAVPEAVGAGVAPVPRAGRQPADWARRSGALQATNGEVTVDLSQVEAPAKQELAAHGLSVFNKVPKYTGAPFVLFQSDQLAKMQRWVRFLNQLALVLPIVAAAPLRPLRAAGP